MMKLFIDAKGGLSGDMFCAALLGLTRERQKVINAMTDAGKVLGECSISYHTHENIYRINIDMSSKYHSISGSMAREILKDLYEQHSINSYYQELGNKILNILIKAEKEAHAKFDFFKKGKFKGPHHSHTQNSHHDNDAHLHEAQDIVIDIMGVVYGMQMLDIESRAVLISPVSVGGGSIDFSHGLLFAPAPATSIILKEHDLIWKKGPIEKELFTPTGASILAGLDSVYIKDPVFPEDEKVLTGYARGSLDYPVPPLKIIIGPA